MKLPMTLAGHFCGLARVLLGRSDSVMARVADLSYSRENLRNIPDGNM
jgi:hypothetical protein